MIRIEDIDQTDCRLRTAYRHRHEIFGETIPSKYYHTWARTALDVSNQTSQQVQYSGIQQEIVNYVRQAL